MLVPSLQALCKASLFEDRGGFITVKPCYRPALEKVHDDTWAQQTFLNIIDCMPANEIARLVLLEDVVDEYNYAIEGAIYAVFRSGACHEKAQLFVQILRAQTGNLLSQEIQNKYFRIMCSLNSGGRFNGLLLNSDVDLTDLNLSGFDICDSNLRGADLSRTNLTDTLLRGCLYDSSTVWPWFVALHARSYHEMIYVEEAADDKFLETLGLVITGAGFVLFCTEVQRMKEWERNW